MGAVLPRRELLAGGAGSVDPKRLQAAVDFVVDRVRPDQLILYGSAARGLFTERSDLDFLAVRSLDSGVDRFPVDHYHWECPATGDDVDVLLATRERLEERRWAAGTDHSTVLSEGVTVFVSPGSVPVQLSPDETDMVKKTLFEPDVATEYVDFARRRFGYAEAAAPDDPGYACELLQVVAERSFKALIIAHGSPFEHTHDLGDLWDQVEAFGERVSAIRDDAILKNITRYAGKYQYDFPTVDEAAASYQAFYQVAGDILDYTERRVPIVQRETAARRAASRGRQAE